MSIICVCAVLDKGAQVFSRPFFVPHVNTANRSFLDEVNRVPSADRPNDLYSHSDDFELYHLADFDESTGLFIPLERGPVLLAEAKRVRQS